MDVGHRYTIEFEGGDPQSNLMIIQAADGLELVDGNAVFYVNKYHHGNVQEATHVFPMRRVKSIRREAN
jgi:hypothetical protein